MSDNKKSLSTPEGGSSENDSVYEFLYHDHRRVGSFLSQFDPGHLSTLTRTHEAHKHTSERFGRAFALGAPKVLGAGNDSSEEEGAGTKDTLQSAYDPYWANALALLNYLDARGLIRRDTASAKLGDVVLFSGPLSIVDLGMIKSMWALPAMQDLIRSNNEAEAGQQTRQERRAAGEKRQPADDLDPNTRLLLEILPTLPHVVTATIGSARHQSWATLEEQFLVGSGSSLVLKHGSSIPGKWHMLGILDAVPDVGSLDGIAEGLGAVNAPPSLPSSLVGMLSGMLAPIVRFLLGRPVEAYGATPLLIFREVVA